MSTMPRTTRRRSRLVGDEHQVARFLVSRRYGYGDKVNASYTGERMGIRVDLPDMDWHGNVQRDTAAVRRTRMEQLASFKAAQVRQETAPVDGDGVRASCGFGFLIVLAVILMIIWLSNVSGLINLNQANANTKASIATVTNRNEELTGDVETAKASVDVAYLATGLGMVPASSTAVVKLSVDQDAIIGPNGIANSDTVSVIRGE